MYYQDKNKAMYDAVRSFGEWRKFKVSRGTCKGYDQDLRFFCLYLGNPAIGRVTISDVMRYLNGMQDLGWDRNSLMRKSVAMRKFFEWCRKTGHSDLDEQLVPVPRMEYRMPRVAGDGELDALLRSISDDSRDPRHVRNAALIRMYADTGARNGELLALDVADVDFEAMKATVRTEKSRGRRPFRDVFWTMETNERLVRWVALRERLVRSADGPLFVGISGARQGQRLTRRGVGELLRRQSERAGIAPVNAHAFRHRRARKIVDAGGSNSDVMNVLGHASILSSTIYTRLQGPELEARARRFMEGDLQRPALRAE